jgi:nuclear pore complex protein Nup54
LRERHSLSNAPRVQRAQATQAQLDQRLVALLAHLHLLIPSLRASALRPEEEALGAALDALATEVRGPPSGGAGRGGAPAVGRLRARLNELWALVGAAAAAKERGGGPGKDGRWAVVDEDGLKEIVQVCFCALVYRKSDADRLRRC